MTNPHVEVTSRDRMNPVVAFLLNRSPLGWLVRWVAHVRASVHTKLLAAFLLITLLFIAMAGVSLQSIARTTKHSRLLDEAHQRVELAHQIDHALALQIQYTALALLLREEGTVARILRENNRFNNTLAQLEREATRTERELIQQIRARQDEAMNAVADIANAIRDGRLDDARASLLGREDRVYREIEALVGRLVEAENTRMASLRDSVEVTNRQSLVVAAGFAVAAIALALLCGFGGGNFASSMANISFFFPKDKKGTALGLNAGLGNLGVSLVQFVVPVVINMGLFGDLGGQPQAVTKAGGSMVLWLQNAGYVWVPFIAASALAATSWTRAKRCGRV